MRVRFLGDSRPEEDYAFYIELQAENPEEIEMIQRIQKSGASSSGCLQNYGGVYGVEILLLTSKGEKKRRNVLKKALTEALDVQKILDSISPQLSPWLI